MPSENHYKSPEGSGFHWDDAVEARFQRRMEKETRDGYLRAALLAAITFPGLSVLDWFTAHEHFGVLTAIRYFGAAVSVIVYWTGRKKIYFAKPFPSGVAVLSFAALIVTWMCLAVGGYRSPYYAGVNLVIVVAAVLFPWGARRMMIAVSCIIGIYVVEMLIGAGFHIEEPAIFINNVSFLVATGILGVGSTMLTDRLRRRQFASLVEIEQAREELRKQDQIKTQFFANVSHELRTPLTLILGPVDHLLVERSLTREQRESLRLIQRNGQTLLKHVNDLLDIAKLQAAKMAAHYSDIDLAYLLRITLSNFEVIATEKRIRLLQEIPTALSAQLDPEKMEKIIVNLLSNALKFTPEHGTVRCVLSVEREGWARITVYDSGPGIPPELRPVIFERFSQVEESTRRRHGGTGLGLAIVKEFAGLQGGKVEVGSAPEGGAAFSVEIPLHAPPGTVLAQWSPQEKASYDVRMEVGMPLEPSRHTALSGAAPLEDGERGLVLVVEDHPEMRDYIAGILRNRFRVVTASDGKEGLALTTKLRPDLVLSDVMMPEMSGSDLMRAIRSRRDLDSIQIVMLTAKADDQLRVELIKEGAQDYILKPFIPEELIARVVNLVAIKRSKEILSDQLMGQQGTLESLAREARSALMVREEFISIASHELKTPVTVMKLQNNLARLKMARSNPDAPESKMLKTLLENNESQLHRLTRLIEDMLDISRINSGQLDLVIKPVELFSLVQNVVEKLHPQLASSGIALRFQKGDPIVGEWDALRIEQVITNILINAIKYAPNAPVEIRINEQWGQAKIEIEDHGGGIEQSEQERIFRKFERVASWTKISGMGLGLYISRKIVQAHQGTLSVRSSVGKGSTFIVMLPIKASR